MSTFEDRLAGYSQTSISALKKAPGLGVMMGSVAALAVGTSESEAAMTVVDLNQAISGPSAVFATFFDVNGDMSVDFEFQRDTDPAYPFVRMGARNGIQIIGRIVSGYAYASRLASGASVNGAGAFLPANSAVNKLMAFSYPASTLDGGDWFGGETGYIGFSIPNGVGGDVNYGWVHVSVNADNVSGTVIRYGIESIVNTPAVTGVPEANSLACLAVGAAGLLGWRQRRKSA